MKWEIFTKKLKSELPKHTSAVDADAIWNAIEPAVDEINLKQKRRRGIGWLTLLGFLLIGGGLSMVLLTNSNNGIAGIFGQQKDSTIAAEKGMNNQLSSTEEERLINNTIQESSSTEEGDAKAEITNGFDDLAGNYSTGGNPAESARAAQKAERVDNRKTKADLRSSTKQSGKSPTSSNQTTGTRSENITNSQFPSEASSTTDLVSNPPVNDINQADALRAGQLNNTHESGAYTSVSSEMTAPARSETLMASLESRSSTVMSRYSSMNSSTTQIRSLSMERRNNPKTDCPKFGKVSGMSFLLGVHGGASYPFKRMTSTEEGDDLLTLRDDTEKSLVSGNMGIDFVLRHRSGIEITTGLQSMTLLERLDLDRTVTTTEFEYGLQAISINPLGDTTYIYGDIPVTTTKQERKRYYNKYKFIEIPILFGFSKEIKNWRVGGEAGVIAGFLSKTEGQILDINEEFELLDGDNPAVSGSSFGMSYYFGATVSHVYESGIELGFSPHVRFSPQDYGSAGYPVRKKYVMAGANLSLRYRFGGK